MYKLIITEKPSVAQSIAAALGIKNRKDGYIEGNGWLISWCLGHLAELADAETYDEKYSKWQLADLPIVPKNWRYVVPAGKKARFLLVRDLMNREDVSEIVNACDAGREGELIFRNVYILANCKKPMLRLWLSSMEEDAIREGFENLHDGSEYDGLYRAALCRAKADWLVGINATRLYSILYHRTLNVGRVMSSTLSMLAQREAEIRAFEPTLFYTPVLKCDAVEAMGERCATKADAEAVIAGCGNTAIVTKVERVEKTVKPPALFDLTTLQRKANRRCGFTAQQTLDYLQSLYEKKLCTYPRTDSRYLTDDMQGLVKAITLRAAELCGVDVSEPENPSAVCNSGKVSDHHAIVPTATAAGMEMGDLPEGERKVLALVCWGVLRAVAGDYRYAETTVSLEAGGHTFTVKETTVLDPGWMQYEKCQREHGIPDFTEGQELEASFYVKEGRTSAPKDFTEDTLLSAMENAGSGDMPEGAERRGIGTPATRAGILEKLIA
ncbi:MAG: DNA topoisomerase, partial [Faecousia sp.]